VETAVRLHHRPSRLVSQAEESRSPEVNRRRALRRLRERIALEFRTQFDLEAPSLPAEFLAQRGRNGSLSVNPNNRAYPIIVATVLDALESAAGSYARAAQALGLTTSQILRFVRSDPHVWRTVSQAKPRGPAGEGPS